MTHTLDILPNDRISFFDPKVHKHLTRTALSVGLDYVKIMLRGSVAIIPATEITSFEITGQS